MSEEIPSEKLAARRYTRILIDSLVSFAYDCKQTLYDAVYLDLDVNKMVTMILNELDKSSGYVICNEYAVPEEDIESITQ